MCYPFRFFLQPIILVALASPMAAFRSRDGGGFTDPGGQRQQGRSPRNHVLFSPRRVAVRQQVVSVARRVGPDAPVAARKIRFCEQFSNAPAGLPAAAFAAQRITSRRVRREPGSLASGVCKSGRPQPIFFLCLQRSRRARKPAARPSADAKTGDGRSGRRPAWTVSMPTVTNRMQARSAHAARGGRAASARA